MRRVAFLSSLMAVFLAAVVLLATDGPLTPIANLRGRTDQNGYLLASSGIGGGTDGPLTPIGQLRGRTEQNGYLRVALAGSSSLTGLTVTQGTLTADAQAVSSTATWNNAGVTFTHWKMAVTNTASNSASNLLELFAGAGGVTSMFSVRAVDGRVTSNSDFVAAASGGFDWAGRSVVKSPADGQINLTNNAENAGAGLDVATDGTLKVRVRAQNADGKVQGIYVSTGTGLAVANVGANSCGTSAATIAGGNNAFVITVGATSGTQCRVTFTFAAATEWTCTVTDATTTIATRATPVDTTHTDFLGAFVAGDKVNGICFPR